MQSLGKKISENYETYYKLDPLERFNKKKIEEELLKEDAPVKDQFPIILLCFYHFFIDCSYEHLHVKKSQKLQSNSLLP